MIKNDLRATNAVKDNLRAVNSFIITLIITIILGAPLIGLALGVAVKWFEWASK